MATTEVQDDLVLIASGSSETLLQTENDTSPPISSISSPNQQKRTLHRSISMYYDVSNPQLEKIAQLELENAELIERLKERDNDVIKAATAGQLLLTEVEQLSSRVKELESLTTETIISTPHSKKKTNALRASNRSIGEDMLSFSSSFKGFVGTLHNTSSPLQSPDARLRYAQLPLTPSPAANHNENNNIGYSPLLESSSPHTSNQSPSHNKSNLPPLKLEPRLPASPFKQFPRIRASLLSSGFDEATMSSESYKGLNHRLLLAEQARHDLELKLEEHENTIDSLKKQLERSSHNEELLNEKVWDLELNLQQSKEHAVSVNSQLSKCMAELNLLQKNAATFNDQLEAVKASEQTAIANMESLKQKYDADLAAARRSTNKLQRDKTGLTARIEEISRSNVSSPSPWKRGNTSSKLFDHHDNHNNNPFDSRQGSPDKTRMSGISSTEGSPSKEQHLHFDSLQSSLSHAQNEIAMLKSSSSNLELEKDELQKLLMEAQDAIAGLQESQNKDPNQITNLIKRRSQSSDFIRQGKSDLSKSKDSLDSSSTGEFSDNLQRLQSIAALKQHLDLRRVLKKQNSNRRKSVRRNLSMEFERVRFGMDTEISGMNGSSSNEDSLSLDQDEQDSKISLKLDKWNELIESLVNDGMSNLNNEVIGDDDLIDEDEFSSHPITLSAIQGRTLDEILAQFPNFTSTMVEDDMPSTFADEMREVNEKSIVKMDIECQTEIMALDKATLTSIDQVEIGSQIDILRSDSDQIIQELRVSLETAESKISTLRLEHTNEIASLKSSFEAETQIALQQLQSQLAFERQEILLDSKETEQNLKEQLLHAETKLKNVEHGLKLISEEKASNEKRQFEDIAALKSEAEAEIEELKLNEENLKNSLKEMESLLALTNIDLSDSKDEVSKLQLELEKSMEELTLKSSESTDIISKLNEELNDLKLKYEKKCHELESKEKIIGDLESTITQLRTDSKSDTESILINAENRVKDAETKLREGIDTITREFELKFETYKHEAQREISELKSQNQIAMAQAETQTVMANLRQEKYETNLAVQIERKQAEANSQIEAIRAEYESLISEETMKTNQARYEIESLKHRLEEITKGRDEAYHQLDQLQKESTESEKTLQELRSQVQYANASAAELSADAQEIRLELQKALKQIDVSQNNTDLPLDQSVSVTMTDEHDHDQSELSPSEHNQSNVSEKGSSTSSLPMESQPSIQLEPITEDVKGEEKEEAPMSVRDLDVDNKSEKNSNHFIAETVYSSSPTSLPIELQHYQIESGLDFSPLISMMQGTMLYKYNRRGVKPQLRFFWVNPYTRSINWGIEEPTSSQSKRVFKHALIESFYTIESYDDYIPNPSLMSRANLLHHRASITSMKFKQSVTSTTSTNNSINNNSSSSLSSNHKINPILVITTKTRELRLIARSIQEHQNWIQGLKLLLDQSIMKRMSLVEKKESVSSPSNLMSLKMEKTSLSRSPRIREISASKDGGTHTVLLMRESLRNCHPSHKI